MAKEKKLRPKFSENYLFKVYKKVKSLRGKFCNVSCCDDFSKMGFKSAKAFFFTLAFH